MWVELLLLVRADTYRRERMHVSYIARMTRRQSAAKGFLRIDQGRL